MNLQKGLHLAVSLLWMSSTSAAVNGNVPECRYLVGPEVFSNLQPEPDPDLEPGFIIFGPDQEVPHDGTIDTWMLMTNQINGNFSIDAWRPIEDKYKLVGSLQVNVSNVNVTVITSEKNSFQVQQGDRLGIHFSNITTLSRILTNNSDFCYRQVNVTPEIGEVVYQADLIQEECAFALRAYVETDEEPCGHLYHRVPTDPEEAFTWRGSETSSAETAGICAIKCLRETGCINFNFRKVINEDGKRHNVCSLTPNKVDDDVETIMEERNCTESSFYT